MRRALLSRILVLLPPASELYIVDAVGKSDRRQDRRLVAG